MDNDGTLPLLVVGKLSKPCYASAQEFADDFVANLRLGSDTVAIIQGAAGAEGKQGKTGARGASVKGDKGDGAYLQSIEVAIPNAATYLEFNAFPGWQNATYQIRYIGAQGSTDIGIPDYDPSNGIVSAGTVVPMYQIPTTTRIRCYFTFFNCTSVPGPDHILQISKVS